jgi:hypothetical protein
MQLHVDVYLPAQVRDGGPPAEEMPEAETGAINALTTAVVC